MQSDHPMRIRPLKALVVGSHPSLLCALEDRAHAYDVDVAKDAFDAIYPLDSGASPYDVIFCDINRDDLPGPELWAYLSVSRPEAAASMVFVASTPPPLEVQAFLERVPNPCVYLPEDVGSIEMLVRQRSMGAEMRLACVGA